MNESGGSKNIEKRQRRQLQRSGLDNCQDYSRPEARQNYGMNEDWGSTVRRGSKLIEERTRVRLGRRGSKPSIIRDCSGSKNLSEGVQLRNSPSFMTTVGRRTDLWNLFLALLFNLFNGRAFPYLFWFELVNCNPPMVFLVPLEIPFLGDEALFSCVCCPHHEGRGQDE